MEERFWSKVSRSSDCWLWTGTNRGNGYGCIKINHRLYDAHRVAYEITHGSIPVGKLVCHKCDNRLCVRPSHLFLGSYKDNMVDASRKGRLRKRNLIHGTATGYRYGCRCSECKGAAKIYKRRWR